MVFLRSEEHRDRWLAGHGWAPGATLTAEQMNELARRWWWNRLEPSWRPRSAEDSQAVLDGLGLTGDFWRLT